MNELSLPQSTPPQFLHVLRERSGAESTRTALLTPIRFRVYALAALMLSALLVCLLSFATIGREAKMTGLVLPASGLVELRSSDQAMRVARWLVAEGDFVASAAPLADLTRSDGAMVPAGLRAPEAGTLFQITSSAPHTGSLPVLGWLAPAGQLAIHVAVPAQARARIEPGAEAVVRIAGLRGAGRFTGRLRSVAVAPSESQVGAGALSYAAVIDLVGVSNPTQQQKLLGLPAEVELTLERRPLYAWLLDPARTLFSE